MATSLRAELTTLIADQRAEGLQVVTLDALDHILNPRHRLTIDDVGSWDVTHPRACRNGAWCDLAAALSTAPLLSSPHVLGRSYEVWLDDGALKFHDTGRAP